MEETGASPRPRHRQEDPPALQIQDDSAYYYNRQQQWLMNLVPSETGPPEPRNWYQVPAAVAELQQQPQQSTAERVRKHQIPTQEGNGPDYKDQVRAVVGRGPVFAEVRPIVDGNPAPPELQREHTIKISNQDVNREEGNRHEWPSTTAVESATNILLPFEENATKQSTIPGEDDEQENNGSEHKQGIAKISCPAALDGSKEQSTGSYACLSVPSFARGRAHIIVGLVLVLVVVFVVVVAAIFGSGKTGGDAGDSNDQTLPPTVDQYDDIPDFINSIKLSTETISYPPGSSATPPELALQWLVEDDPLQFSVDTSAEQFRLGQRFALLVIWFALSGESWDVSTGWLTNSDECQWYGVSCAETDLGGDFGYQDVVLELRLFEDSNPWGVSNWGDGNNLQGTIPEDLALLTALKHLELVETIVTGWSEPVTGSIPDAIGVHLLKLTTLDLGNLDLTGTLPASLGNLTDLRHFDVWYNNLRGTIPPSISNWQNIETAFFSENDFTGSMPTGICSAPNLDRLEADCEVECSCCTFHSHCS